MKNTKYIWVDRTSYYLAILFIFLAASILITDLGVEQLLISIFIVLVSVRFFFPVKISEEGVYINRFPFFKNTRLIKWTEIKNIEYIKAGFSEALANYLSAGKIKITDKDNKSYIQSTLSRAGLAEIISKYSLPAV